VSRLRRPGGRTLRVLAVLLVVIGVPVVLAQVSVQPGAAVVKAAFGISPLVKTGPGYAAAAAQVGVVRGLRIPVAGAPDAGLDVYTPRAPAAKPRPIVLWVHGGGFLSGSSGQVADFATMLAGQGFVVASLDYSLAPGQRYPTPVRQANAALGYLSRQAGHFGGDASAMMVGGDSAGAQIASQLAALQTNPALASRMRIPPAIPAAHLRATVLYCGLYDLSTVGRTHFPALRTFLWAYTGRRDWTSAPGVDDLSTTRQVTAQYPATYLTVGDADPFESQAYELDSVLRAHGVDVQDRFWTGTGAELGHEYQFDYRTAAARSVFAGTVTFLHAHGG
jgi:acetyl esterase/lipase